MPQPDGRGVTRGLANRLYRPKLRIPRRVCFDGPSFFDGYASIIAWQAEGILSTTGNYAWNRRVGMTVTSFVAGYSGGRYLTAHAGGAGARTIRDSFGLLPRSDSSTQATTGELLLTDALYTKRVKPFRGDACWICWGTNESAPYAANSYHSTKEFMDLMKRRIAQVYKDGMDPFVLLCPPYRAVGQYTLTRSDSTSEASMTRAEWIFHVNDLVRAYCETNGIPFVDAREVVGQGVSVNLWRDDGDGKLYTPSNDQTHFRTGWGVKAMARAMVACMDRFYGEFDVEPMYAGEIRSDGVDPSHSFVNYPWFNGGTLGTLNTNYRPTGWNRAGDTNDANATFSLVDAPSGWESIVPTGGKVMQITRLANHASGTAARWTHSIAGELLSEKRHCISGWIELSGYNDNVAFDNTDAGTKGPPAFTIDVSMQANGTTTTLTGPIENLCFNTEGPIFFHHEFYAPPGVETGTQMVEIRAACRATADTDYNYAVMGNPVCRISGLSCRTMEDLD